MKYSLPIGISSFRERGGRLKKRQVFIGSSHEALDKAEYIRDLLLPDFEDVKGLLWTEFFDPGFLTFEALETMLTQCCGAILIATPDDEITLPDRCIRSPRANVLLEFGLIAGRL